MLIWHVCKQEQVEGKKGSLSLFAQGSGKLCCGKEKSSSLFTHLTVGHLDSLGTIEPSVFSGIYLIHEKN